MILNSEAEIPQDLNLLSRPETTAIENHPSNFNLEVIARLLRQPQPKGGGVGFPLFPVLVLPLSIRHGPLL